MPPLIITSHSGLVKCWALTTNGEFLNKSAKYYKNAHKANKGVPVFFVCVMFADTASQEAEHLFCSKGHPRLLPGATDRVKSFTTAGEGGCEVSPHSWSKRWRNGVGLAESRAEGGMILQPRASRTSPHMFIPVSECVDNLVTQVKK